MSAPAANPYATPDSEVVVAGDESYNDAKIFSTSGRIGRLRYLAYSGILTFLVTFLYMFAVAILAPLAEDPRVLMFCAIIFYVVTFAAQFIYAKRRVHDRDYSGWLAILLLVPLVNVFFVLYLLFAPGEEKANTYGAPPPPNTTGVILAAFLPLLFLAILTAITIPAYLEYVERAEQSAFQAIE